MFFLPDNTYQILTFVEALRVSVTIHPANAEKEELCENQPDYLT